MELKRILARDSKAATDEALAKYGKDVLIVSSNRVNGLTELIVAIDVQSTAQPSPASAATQPTFKPATDAVAAPNPEAQRLAHEWSRFESQGNPNRADLTAPKQAIREFASALERTQLGAGTKSESSATQDSHAEPAAKTIAPSMKAASDTATALVTPNGIGTAPPITTDERAREAMRAEEIVELLKVELQALRREFRLSQGQQSAVQATPSEAMQPLFAQLVELNLPAKLSQLIHDCWSGQTDPIAALGALESSLAQRLPQSVTDSVWQGVHVVSGPSGSGKTTLVSKLAMQAAAQWDADEVAWISLADHRPGAWGQTQLSAAASGVATYRAKDAHALQALLAELSHMKLILIDTAGVQFELQADVALEAAPDAKLHMVLPLDATHTHARAVLSRPRLESLMLSKVDEAQAPWPCLNALLDHGVCISHINDNPRQHAPLQPFQTSALVERAMSALCQSPASTPPGSFSPAEAGSASFGTVEMAGAYV